MKNTISSLIFLMLIITNSEIFSQNNYTFEKSYVKNGITYNCYSIKHIQDKPEVVENYTIKELNANGIIRISYNSGKTWHLWYENNNNTDFKIYPNPVVGNQINIELSEFKNNFNYIEIIDIHGNTVDTFDSIHSNLLSVNTDKLKHGTYYVRIIVDNTILKSKCFIVE